jgi:hypothetical protein
VKLIACSLPPQHGKTAGHDNEACTASFHRDVLCQDIVVLNGQGDLQASWTLQNR